MRHSQTFYIKSMLENIEWAIKNDSINNCRFSHFLHQLMCDCLMVINDTFNNIPALSWQSDLLVEETGGPGENHRPVASH